MKLKLEHKKEYILSEIDKGVSIQSISKILNENSQPVRNIIKKYRPDLTFTLNSGNLDYFKIIDTDKKAYFIGFIAADGAIVKSTNSNSHTMTITIHSKDRIILDKLKEDIGCENQVRILNTHNHVRFTLSKKEFINDLMKLGIKPNKSLTITSLLSNIPQKFHKSFLRGYFDGDGSIFKTVTEGRPKGRYYISIRGTTEFLKDYITVFELSSYSLNTTSENISSLSIGSKENILKIFSMYESSEIHLNRKYEKFLSFIEEKCQDKTISSTL